MIILQLSIFSITPFSMSFQIDSEGTKSCITEYEACWHVDHRGAVGETPLHLLILLQTYVTISIAKILLTVYPKMAHDIYEGEEYYGICCRFFYLYFILFGISSETYLYFKG